MTAQPIAPPAKAIFEMPASMLLDARSDLLAKLDEDKFARQVAFMVASQAGATPANGVIHDVDAADAEAKRHLPAVGILKNHLRVAEVYRVSPDMASMIQYAASQLDETDLIDISLAPTGCGIVRFDQPLPVKEIRGKTMLINWLVWGPLTAYDKDLGRENSGIALWAFNDTVSTPDDTHLEMLEQSAKMGGPSAEWYNNFVGRFATIGIDLMRDGRALGPHMQPPSARQMMEVLAEGVPAPGPGTNTMRYAHALWLMLNQTVTKIEDEQVERPARRRAYKAHLPSTVTVIRLRREVSTMAREHGESSVEWQHRWITRGHWRWQVVGEHYPGAVETDKGYRARIWINPFIKGPEGAPIKQSDKIYSLDR
jgi:hypothetical protein